MQTVPACNFNNTYVCILVMQLKKELKRMEEQKKNTYPDSKPEDKQYQNQDEFDNRSKNEKVTGSEDNPVKTSTGKPDESIRNQDSESE